LLSHRNIENQQFSIFLWPQPTQGSRFSLEPCAALVQAKAAGQGRQTTAACSGLLILIQESTVERTTGWIWFSELTRYLFSAVVFGSEK